jgi:uncharacterized protein YjbI with pentapeptide repeats
MNDLVRSRQSLGQILDRLVERASGETPASFASLAKAAGLDPARDFVGASLREIDLRGEDLREFDFSKADLVGADLRGANLDGVSFSGADTTGCLGLPRNIERVSEKPLEPPPDFDLAEVKRMILAGASPRLDWVPFIDKLDFSDEPLTDLSPLAGLSGLQRLDLWGTRVSDLSALAGLSGLQSLDLDGTPVSDVSPLAGLIGLQNLNLVGTPVSDV